MNITVLGAGFASLTAISQLRKQLPNASIRVITPSITCVYYPSLIWIPSGQRKGEEIGCNLSNYFNKHNVEFIEAHVTGITDQGRTVNTNVGDFSNEGLIIATGCQFAKDLSGIEHTHIICEGIASAQAIKKQLKVLNEGTIAIGCDVNPAEPSAKRGAGAILEFILGIDTLLRQQKRRDNFQIVFFSSEKNPMAQLGKKASDSILKQLTERNITMQFGEAINGFGSHYVELESQQIAADLILFQPAMTGADWLENSTLPRSPAGLIQSDEYAQASGCEKVYVAGEAGSYPGPDWQPKLGVNAEIQAKAAAKNLVNEMNQNGENKQRITPQLVYIIDSLTHGMLVKRSEKGEKALPPMRLFHLVKKLIEWSHLRKWR